VTSETREKFEHLKDYIKGLGSLGVAFSAGVDSTFLLKVGHDVLGPKCVAFSGISPSFPKKEQEEAKGFCAKENIRLILFNSTEMNDENYIKNPTNRCYYCKRDLFIKISELAKKENIGHIADGSNADDTGDYRPGLVAASEMHVISPLKETGITKAEIREISRELGLTTWNKPSMACLSSRIPYGDMVTEPLLNKIEAGENILRNLGLTNVRLRVHRDIARIETDISSFNRIIDEKNRIYITEEIKKLGFNYVTLDLSGFKSGSMNAEINQQKGEAYGVSREQH